MIFGKSKKPHLEIERKFLITERPAEKPLKIYKIQQGYIARENGNMVRIRRRDKDYILTIKTPAPGIGRHEVEVRVSKNEGRILFEACANSPVEKIRELYQIGDHMWELDIFSGYNDGLMVAEIELSTEQEKFTRPDWLGPEVTSYKKFSNASLSRKPFNGWGVTYADLVARIGG